MNGMKKSRCNVRNLFVNVGEGERLLHDTFVGMGSTL